MTLYAVKPRFQIALRQVAGWCAARGITPDVLTVAGVICAAVAGMLLAMVGQSGWLWLVPPLLFARIAANALDGMVARATEAGHPWGSVVNETGDRVADMLVFGGFVVGGAVTGPLALAVVPAVLFVSYLGVIGQAAGGTRRYDGPLGKADRMLLLGAYCPLAFLTPHAGTVIALALLVGLALTAVNRVRAMQVELS